MLRFEDPQEPWLPQRMALSLLGFVLFTAVHIGTSRSYLPASMANDGLAGNGSERSEHQLKLREEMVQAQMLQTRIEMMKKIHAIMIHVCYLFQLASLWRITCDPSFFSFCQLLATTICHFMFFFAGRIVRTEHGFRKYAFFMICLHSLFVLSIVGEKDLVVFDMLERLAAISPILTSMILIDINVTLPLFFGQQAVLIYCRWNLIGFGHITPAHAFATIIQNVIVGSVIALCNHFIKSNIEAKIDSGDASTLMMGFQQILRGVCDGDLILDRRTMTIVDDASCLEHILKSNRKLTNSNFLDLFLDLESRERFRQFVAAGLTAGSSIPRGLRVVLQGARGAVSMDLFYTALPRPGASSDYCLLAMKEDPEQSAPPEAPPDSVPQGIQGGSSTQTRTRSSISELVVAYDDLVEVALLVSDVTGFLDLEEVHLSFHRKSEVSNIEAGMPTLRKFIRPFDWDRIEQMFSIVTNLAPSEQQRRCYFQRPTLFRVPGESRSYLCARSTSLSLADESVVPGRPTRFWMHLSQFDSSQIHRVPQPELEGIAEEQ